MRNKPQTITCYGYTYSYRFEKRKKGLTIVFSYRVNGKILYESERSVPKTMQANSDEEIAREMLPRFIADLYSCMEDKEDWQKSVLATERRNLPLATVWLLDKDIIAKEQGWSKATAEDNRRTADRLITLWGERALREIDPGECDCELKRMRKSAHKRCVMLMQTICRQEMFNGNLAIEENKWKDYRPDVFRQRRSRAASMNSNIENQQFTSGQYTRIVEHCFKRMESDKKNQSLYLCALLFFLMGIDVHELCALSYASIRPLEYYSNRFVLIIGEEMWRRDGKKNYQKRVIEDAYRIRILPCSQLISYVIKIMRTSFIERHGSAESYAYPLLGDRKNVKRRMSPQRFLAWLCAEFQSILQENQVLSPREKERTEAKTVAMVKRTVENNLEKTGFEAEEVRYFFGKMPLMTSAKHYAGYFNDAELNRLGALQDRWHRDFYQVPEEPIMWTTRSGQPLWKWQNSTPGLVGAVTMQIKVGMPKKPDAGKVVLCLVVRRGMSYNIRLNLEQEGTE